MKKRQRNWLAIALITIASFGSFGFVESYFEISKNLDIFSTVYREINVNYVEETNPGKLVKTGIDAMLASLDPYTNYIPESDIEDYRFMTTHEYGGVGALIGTRGENVIITEPYEGFPADKAGLKAGDIILSVDGETAEGKNTSQLSDMLRGQNGTSISVKIKREATNEILDREIIREKIKLDDVPYFGMLSEGVGYISLNSFTQTASADVKAAYKELKDNGMEELVIDLRGNGGGLLHESVNIVNFFIEKGEDVVEVKGKVKEHYRMNKALNVPLDLEIPLVVLIDEGSASASEIVSGSLQDLDRAVIIGHNSYGKGLVQTTHDLSYNSKLKLTIAKYYTPSGRCIQRIDYGGNRDAKGKAKEIPDSLLAEFTTRGGRTVKDGMGITPDIEVEDQEYSDLLATLMRENLIFDFATKFYFSNDSIAKPEDFKLTTAQFNDFKSFVMDHEFEYKTSSTEMMKELKSVVKDDEFWTEVASEYEALAVKLERDKGTDMQKFEPEIRLMLENEIIGRYYYSKGRIRAYLSEDPEIAKAIEVLNNKSYYDSVLDGTCTDCLVKKG
ncbi:S41 family peptidase [Salibacteraceae bacterium]|nr:S41 family peptidase [Salibacteraceae bacterium]